MPGEDGEPKELCHLMKIESALDDILQKSRELTTAVAALEEAFRAPMAPAKPKPASRGGKRGKVPAKKATVKPADKQSKEIEKLRRKKSDVDDQVSRLVSENDALERQIAALGKQVRRVTDGMDYAYEPMRRSGDNQLPSFREFFDDYRRKRT
jgi:DNA repair exonuclease SbcCD ATPase subunit